MTPLRTKDAMSQQHSAIAPAPAPAKTRRGDWWRDAVIYQVYPRSFADSNGDGMGDLEGVRSRLTYLRDLGVDAVWLSPFYASPQADAGYDVADYRAVDPMFGNLLDADALIRDAHELALRIIVDLVPNHSSDQHEWFKRALREGPGSPSASATTSAPARARTANSRPTTGSPSSAARPGPASPSRTARRGSGTSTSSPPSSPTSTGSTPPSATSSARSCASGSTSASTASASTWPTAW